VIRAKDIPDEVESAAWNASGDNMKAAIAAAINAWPGAAYVNWRNYGEADRIVLPLLHKKNVT
jgi:hypothetical protein